MVQNGENCSNSIHLNFLKKEINRVMIKDTHKAVVPPV